MEWLSKTDISFWGILVKVLISKDNCENKDQGPLKGPKSYLTIANRLDNTYEYGRTYDGFYKE